MKTIKSTKEKMSSMPQNLTNELMKKIERVKAAKNRFTNSTVLIKPEVNYL